MKFDCPECQRPIEVEPRFIGKEASCPYCQKLIRVPAGSGDPPPVAVPVTEPLPAVPKRNGSALQLALLVVGIVIALLLFRIERQLASIPRLEDWYDSKGWEVPASVSGAERRAPVVSAKGAVELEDGARVQVDNRLDDPVPVTIRE